MPFTLGGDWISHEDVNKKEKAKKPARITREKRKHAIITVIHNLPYSKEEMKDLLKELKIKLGTGGAIKDDTIQIQGDHTDKLKKLLSTLRPDLKLR